MSQNIPIVAVKGDPIYIMRGTNRGCGGWKNSTKQPITKIFHVIVDIGDGVIFTTCIEESCMAKGKNFFRTESLVVGKLLTENGQKYFLTKNRTSQEFNMSAFL